MEKAVKSYVEKNVQTLKYSKPGQAYAVLKILRCSPAEYEDDDSFVLQNHLDQNLSISQSTELIASHFAKISQEFHPLD